MRITNATAWLSADDQVTVGGSRNLWIGNLSLFVDDDLSGVKKLDELISAAQELKAQILGPEATALIAQAVSEPTVQLADGRDETGADTDDGDDDDTDASYDAAVDAELEDRAEAL